MQENNKCYFKIITIIKNKLKGNLCLCEKKTAKWNASFLNNGQHTNAFLWHVKKSWLWKIIFETQM